MSLPTSFAEVVEENVTITSGADNGWTGQAFVCRAAGETTKCVQLGNDTQFPSGATTYFEPDFTVN